MQLLSGCLANVSSLMRDKTRTPPHLHKYFELTFDIFFQYLDNIQKYHAETNAKVISFMMKNRDDKVKNLLRDSVRYTKYLFVMGDLNKQHEGHNDSIPQHHQGGQ